MSQSLLKKSIILFMVIYCLAGFYFTRDNKEVFPFFSWNLFSRVPGETYVGYDLLIHKAGTKQFDPPIFASETEGIYKARDKNSAVYHAVNTTLALSLKEFNLEEVLRHRAILESKFLQHPVEYEVVSLKFNTIERFKTGRILEMQSLGKFTSAQKKDE